MPPEPPDKVSPKTPRRPSPTLPSTANVDLAAEVVPAVRAMLRRGLPEDFVRSCVRIGDFQCFGGGFKTELVGGLRIDVNAAMKLGGAELERHALLMERVNRARPRTFPSVQAVVPLGGDRRLLFMEQLLGHDTLLDLVYRRNTRAADLERIVDHVFAAARGIRRAYQIEPRALSRLPHTADPYGDRIRERLRTCREADPDLEALWTREGRVLGEIVPPLELLLEDLDRWLPVALRAAPKSLCHGDLHLGNVMARKRGRGHSVRLIDPNPAVGISDPLYDAGKLLHWAEPVGWAAIEPSRCRATLRLSGRGYTLSPRLDPPSAAAERRREAFEHTLRARLEKTRRADATRPARLEVATAAAHVGLATFLVGPGDAGARRFTLAYALRALGAFHRLRDA